MNDYIKMMRAMIGHETILTVGCGAIIEDESGRILLQKRSDYGVWGVPGGLLEIGETFEASVKREVLEETGLTIHDLGLFGVYSGEKGYAQYENGDKVFSVQVIFISRKYEGVLQRNHESRELDFFHKNTIPGHLNSHQAPFINDWLEGKEPPIIK